MNVERLDYGCHRVSNQPVVILVVIMTLLLRFCNSLWLGSTPGPDPRPLIQSFSHSSSMQTHAGRPGTWPFPGLKGAEGLVKSGQSGTGCAGGTPGTAECPVLSSTD